MIRYPLVSVVVPIYNTAQYLGNCIKSLISQTYENIEIILVDDGSTDDSLSLCQKWNKKDGRIIVHTKKNEGPGIARNYGLCASNGKYVAFIDADDWLDNCFIEIMVEACEKYSTDIAVCDIAKVVVDVQEKILERRNLKMKASNQGVYSVSNDESIMYNFGASLCNKLYRRNFLIKLNLPQIKEVIEDMCVASIHIARANGVAYIPQCLYYYRQHSESATFNPKLFDKIYHSIRVYYENVSNYIPDMRQSYTVKKIISDGIAYFCFANRKSKDVDDKSKFLKDEFINTFEVKPNDIGMINCAVYGSYNLRGIIKELKYFDSPYYGFTSLISLMSFKEELKNEIKHNNPFRLEALKKEYSNEFFADIKDREYLFIDFLEERFHVAETQEGNFITLSDAYYESIVSNLKIKRPIHTGTDEWIELWEEACSKFINYIIKETSVQHIVLVRMRMMRFYGENGKDYLYDKQKKIQEINNMIERVENIFLERMPSAIIVDFPNEVLYTDETFAFGCYPWHLNEKAYAEISKIIRFKLKEKIKDINSEGNCMNKKIIIYGAGELGKGYYNFLESKGASKFIYCFCDNNFKNVKEYKGKPVYDYNEVKCLNIPFMVAIRDNRIKDTVETTMQIDNCVIETLDIIASWIGEDSIAFNREFCAFFHSNEMEVYFQNAENENSLKTFWDNDSIFYKMFLKLNLDNVIEIACGRGRHVEKYLNAAKRITLVDILQKNLEYCEIRYSKKSNITYYCNNGYNLEKLESNQYTSVFSYDAVVHFEMMDIYEYLKDIYRVLLKGGRALLHHSNNTSDYRASFANASHARNFMSREIFAYFAYRIGFVVINQQVINWGECKGLDCITLLEKR